jgi:hypothetical protein
MVGSPNSILISICDYYIKVLWALLYLLSVFLSLATMTGKANPKVKDISELEYELKRQELELKEREYKLRRNEEVTKFLEQKQKFTYFLITGSVAVVAFLVDFILKTINITKTPWFSVAIFAAVLGVLTAGSALLSLYYEHESFKIHLKYLHQEKDYISLEPGAQLVWDRLNARAARYLRLSFVGIFMEISASVAFFIGYFLSHRSVVLPEL